MKRTHRAFVSSTYEDLKDHRAHVIRVLRKSGIHVDPMEEWTADSDQPKTFSQQRVEGCDLCVLLVAFRRGYIPDGETLSITQLEYRAAIDNGLEIRPFLLHEDAPWPRRFDEMDRDPEITAWRGQLEKDHGVEYFHLDPASVDIGPALNRWMAKQAMSAPADVIDLGSTPAALAQQKHAYLARVAEAHQWIDLGGLAPQVGTELLRLPIDDVFIHLHAERDAPLVDQRVREEFRLRHELQDRGAPQQQIEQELESLWARTRKGEQAEPSGGKQRVEIAEALKHRRIVLLGDPGAGKTTLLRYLARTVAAANEQPGLDLEPGLLPVYIRLGEYERYCERQQLINLTEYLPIAARARELGLSAELLDACAAAGKCLFLLDGLDEIVRPGRRQAVRDRVAEFCGRHAGCRVVVTSRIVGYRDAQLPGGEAGYRHFTLSPFDDDQIARFARRWYEAIRSKGEVGDPARQNAEALTDGIRGNPSVRRLATNPLLMTLIALLYWREVRLPRRRIELYRDAAQTLLSRWVEVRTPDVAATLDEREATTLLMAVAFRMHAQSSSGLISRPELERVLVEHLTDPRRGGLAELEAQRAVGRFLAAMGQHVGLLYPRGYDDRDQEVFGFLHLTFEEYFAGRELARRWEQGEIKLADHLHRARWEEPIRLASAHLSDADNEKLADRFVREILQAGSPYEDLCHRDLLLAARCLGDDARVYHDLAERILTGLDRALSTSIVPLNKQIAATFGTMRGSRVGAQACHLLLRKLDDENRWVRRSAANALGRLGDSAATAQALARLLERLEHESADVREVAARVLAGLGVSAATPDVVGRLLERLGDESADVRSAAAVALGGLGASAATPEVVGQLLERLGDEAFGVRHAAAWMLRGLGALAATPELLGQLLRRLQDESADVRSQAAFALGVLGESAVRPEMVSQLLECLGDKSAGVRSAAAGAMGGLGASAARREVVTGLLERLGDESASVRYAASRALGGLGTSAATPEVVAALLERVRDESEDVRFAASGALGRLGESAATPEVVAGLLERLGDESEHVRSAAAEALGRLGESAATPEVVAELLERLGYESEGVREAAAGALGSLGASAATPEVLARLLERLGDERPVVRSAAAGALSALGASSATPELLKRLEDEEDDVRYAAGRALGRLGPPAAAPEVLAGLLERLGDESALVGCAAAQALGRLGASAATKEVLDALGQAASAADAARSWPRPGDAAIRALSELLTYYHPGGE